MADASQTRGSTVKVKSIRSIFFSPCISMIATAHTLLSRMYFEAKLAQRSYSYTYPIEREIYRLIEPAQRESERVAEYLPSLVNILMRYFNREVTSHDVFNLLPRFQYSVTYSKIQPLVIYGQNDHTIYFDFQNDGLTYIIERIAYYEDVPVESVEILSSGEVIKNVEPGAMFGYSFVASPLSYCILPYLPPRLDVSGDVNNSLYGFTQDIDFEGVD